MDSHFAEARTWYGFTGWLMLDGGYSNDGSWLYNAEEQFRRALQDDPNCASAHAHFAAVFFYQAQRELARLELERALEIDPRNTHALHLQMHDRHLNGDYSSAELLAKALIERELLFWPTRMMLGDLRRQQGYPNESIAELQKILEQDTQNIYALQYLARAHMDAGDLESAHRTPETARMVADFYAILGEADTAFAWLERAVRNGDERTEGFAANPCSPVSAAIRASGRFWIPSLIAGNCA